MNKKLFLFLYWFLSFTWALPTTLLGAIVALGLIITGHKPKKFCSSICFPITEDWGLELGIFFICSKDKSVALMEHEYGHQLQACFLLGPLTIFWATIPSIARYWMREANSKVKRAMVVSIFCLIMVVVIGCLLCLHFVLNNDLFAFISVAVMQYMCIVGAWLVGIKNRYDLYGLDDYDDFWVEGDASKRGKEAHEKFFM